MEMDAKYRDRLGTDRSVAWCKLEFCVVGTGLCDIFDFGKIYLWEISESLSDFGTYLCMCTDSCDVDGILDRRFWSAFDLSKTIDRNSHRRSACQICAVVPIPEAVWMAVCNLCPVFHLSADQIVQKRKEDITV